MSSAPADPTDPAATDAATDAAEAPYRDLTPERLLDAVDSTGLRTDGRLLALNSYENRVYQVWLEDDSAVVAKFYRPGRWTDASILEEHQFAAELAARELPVVAPLAFGGRTLLEHRGYRFAISPRRGGRAPELTPSPPTISTCAFGRRRRIAGSARMKTW